MNQKNLLKQNDRDRFGMPRLSYILCLGCYWVAGLPVLAEWSDSQVRTALDYMQYINQGVQQSESQLENIAGSVGLGGVLDGDLNSILGFLEDNFTQTSSGWTNPNGIFSVINNIRANLTIARDYLETIDVSATSIDNKLEFSNEKVTQIANSLSNSPSFRAGETARPKSVFDQLEQINWQLSDIRTNSNFGSSGTISNFWLATGYGFDSSESNAWFNVENGKYHFDFPIQYYLGYGWQQRLSWSWPSPGVNEQYDDTVPELQQFIYVDTGDEPLMQIGDVLYRYRYGIAPFDQYPNAAAGDDYNVQIAYTAAMREMFGTYDIKRMLQTNSLAGAIQSLSNGTSQAINNLGKDLDQTVRNSITNILEWQSSEGAAEQFDGMDSGTNDYPLTQLPVEDIVRVSAALTNNTAPLFNSQEYSDKFIHIGDEFNKMLEPSTPGVTRIQGQILDMDYDLEYNLAEIADDIHMESGLHDANVFWGWFFGFLRLMFTLSFTIKVMRVFIAEGKENPLGVGIL